MGTDYKEKYDRVLLDYVGHEPGPLLIIFAAVHGNEPAGAEALKIVQTMLDEENIKNPDFSYCGQVVGMVGHMRALREGVRFFDSDLNRSWSLKTVMRLLDGEDTESIEEEEMNEILTILLQVVEEAQPEKIYILDLHTTSAPGGLFSLATDDEESLNIAVNLHAPVVLGILHGVKGTLMGFFNSDYFHIPTIAITFESGQHQEPLAIQRAVSATINFMRSTSSVYPQDVESKHDEILRRDTAYLPNLTKLEYAHPISQGDGFRMKPGYRNFQSVGNGEHLANDFKGPIHCPIDGILLMPLYQKKGDDGFFIISEIKE